MDERTLRRIKALRAKAASTTSLEEATAYTEAADRLQEGADKRQVRINRTAGAYKNATTSRQSGGFDISL